MIFLNQCINNLNVNRIIEFLIIKYFFIIEKYQSFINYIIFTLSFTNKNLFFLFIFKFFFFLHTLTILHIDYF